MAVTYPTAYEVPDAHELVIPAMSEDPLGAANRNGNAIYRLHKPPLTSSVWTVDALLTRQSRFRVPVSPSADGLAYRFEHRFRTGTGTTNITVTVEWQSAGGGWTTIHGATGYTAAASSRVSVSHTATIPASADELRITYDRGSDQYTPDSLLVYPEAGSPTTRTSSGHWPYDDGLAGATGAPINTEFVNRPIRNARAAYGDRAQALFSYAQEDDTSSGGNVRHDLTASTAVPADGWQTIGYTAVSVPYWPAKRTIRVAALCTVSAGSTGDRVRVRTVGGPAVTLDGDGAINTGSLSAAVKSPGTLGAYFEVIVEARAESSRSTFVHAVSGWYLPSVSSALTVNTVAPPASISLLLAAIRGVEALALSPWPQPGHIFEGNATNLTVRQFAAIVPPAVQKLRACITRATEQGATGAAQSDTTIAADNTSGIPASPATDIVTVDTPTVGSEGFLDVDGSELVAALLWSSGDNDDAGGGGSTLDRMLEVAEALAPAVENVEVTNAVGFALHYARVRAPGDYAAI